MPSRLFHCNMVDIMKICMYCVSLSGDAARKKLFFQKLPFSCCKAGDAVQLTSDSNIGISFPVPCTTSGNPRFNHRCLAICLWSQPRHHHLLLLLHLLLKRPTKSLTLRYNQWMSSTGTAIHQALRPPHPLLSWHLMPCKLEGQHFVCMGIGGV